MSLQVALGISTTMTDMEEATRSKWTGGAINDSDEMIQILSALTQYQGLTLPYLLNGNHMFARLNNLV